MGGAADGGRCEERVFAVPEPSATDAQRRNAGVGQDDGRGERERAAGVCERKGGARAERHRTRAEGCVCRVLQRRSVGHRHRRMLVVAGRPVHLQRSGTGDDHRRRGVPPRDSVNRYRAACAALVVRAELDRLAKHKRATAVAASGDGEVGIPRTNRLVVAVDIDANAVRRRRAREVQTARTDIIHVLGRRILVAKNPPVARHRVRDRFELEYARRGHALIP